MANLNRRTCRLVTALLASLVLTGCGMGLFDTGSGKRGSGGGAEAPKLSILTTTLPSASMDQTYPSTQLEATGARGPVSWNLSDGTLPDGLSLSSSGMLQGMPHEQGVFDFGVRATDGYVTDTRSLRLSVDVFTLVSEGLKYGDAWVGTPIVVSALGQTSNVDFQVVNNESGGSFSSVDAASGHATYVAGTTQGAQYDRIRATDVATGKTAEVLLHVCPNPVAGFSAEWGSSDVWYVNFDALWGGQGYSRDFDAVLARTGLRAPESRDLEGTEADRLASALVRRATLSHLAMDYGRNADGTRGSGLPISFPFERPSGAYAVANPGGWIDGNPYGYSVISLNDGSRPGVLGTAILDSTYNELEENDSNAPETGELGVFANQLVTSFNVFYSNYTLPTAPVSALDVPALRALLYHTTYVGIRYNEIQRVVDGLGASVALVLAHEIGHSVGLGHTNPYTDGSIMNASITMYPGADYHFVPGDWAELQQALPGAGRYAGKRMPDGQVTSTGVPEGIQVCQVRLAQPTCSCGRHAHGK